MLPRVDRDAARRSRTPWRSTSRWAARPTPSCTCWPPRTRPGVDFGLTDIDALSRRVPCLCKVAPSSRVPHGGRAPGRRHPRHPRRAGPGRAARTRRAHRARRTLDEWLDAWDMRRAAPAEAQSTCSTRRPAASGPPRPSRSRHVGHAGHRRGRRRASGTWSTPTPTDGGLAVLSATSPPTARRQDGRRRPRSCTSRARRWSARARRRRSSAILGRHGRRRRRRRHPLRGPQGRAGHAGDALPDQLPQGPRPGPGCALITDGRFSGGTIGSFRSATSPRRPRPEARSRWSRTATRS